MITKILIANRGEIACRIIKTARQMGIETVSIASTPDTNARHTQLADHVVMIGGDSAVTSYLDQDKVIKAAKDTGADAIHPGYGFLSENPEFVDAVEAAGLIFIGPTSDAIRAMGLKDKAKQLMAKAGVPVIPGYDGTSQEERTLKTAADDIGYPVMIKARAGGGGKGMRRVDDRAGFVEALNTTKREAAASFGDDYVLIEKCITAPRHIEVQVFADTHGNTVHLFERDCTLQRRHQKVIEEAPAPGMTEEMRLAMTDAAIKAATAIGYRGAGTVEFIVDGAAGIDFWFMEMNTRLQVEHPVTEEVTGFDLVAWQILVASGAPLPAQQDDITLRGHAIETRIYAEDAAAGFLPAPGPITKAVFPDGIRVDHGINDQDQISPYYDPLIAKMITVAATRDAALDLMVEGLANTHLMGTITNTSFLAALATDSDVHNMSIDTTWIDRHQTRLIDSIAPSDAELALLTLAHYAADGGFSDHGHGWCMRGWRMWGEGTSLIKFEIGNTQHERKVVRKSHDECVIQGSSGDIIFSHISIDGNKLNINMQGSAYQISYIDHHGQISVNAHHRGHRIMRIDPLTVSSETTTGDTVTAPMTGIITVLECVAGDHVKLGDVLARIEAMKMEHALTAPCDGVVASIAYNIGDSIADGAVLISMTPDGDEA